MQQAGKERSVTSNVRKGKRERLRCRRRTFRNGLLLVLCLSMAGCLPLTCRRTESRALTPADSLSRQIAEALTPDTLRLAWAASGRDTLTLAYPRTVQFGPEGRLYVSDAERNSLFVFAEEGTLVEEVTWEGAAVPYLIGSRGDTLVVFSPEAHHIDFVVDGRQVGRAPTPADLPRGPLQYAAATGDALYVKVLAKDFEGYLVRLDEAGDEQARVPLPQPYWRYAGLLRAWGDTLLSLSGYRPVVDVMAPGTTTLDTLALVGFDSPMLARSYQFMLGDEHEAPLLSTAAAPAGDRLFVLNLRPGWLQIDVYSREGRLQHVLIQENPGFNKQFYPMDLAVEQDAEGGYRLAVVTVEPAPEVRLYRWAE